MQGKVEKYLKCTFDFLFTNYTYEIGNLYQLWLSSKTPSADFFNTLVDSIVRHMEEFTDQGADGPASQFLDLVLLILDSLIFNLYTTLRQQDKTKVNNSLYGASVNSNIVQESAFMQSQMYAAGQSEFQQFLVAMEKLLSNRKFFEELETLLNFNNSDQNRLQFSIFIDSLEYMAEKEGITEEAYNKYEDNRQLIEDFIVEKQKMAVQEEIDQINDLLFSNKILKLKKLISVRNDTASPREVHFTILRIYFAAYSKKRTNSNRKQISKIAYSGEDMLNTIFKMYISNHNKRDTLFKESKIIDPLFDFIINLLLLLFMPVYNNFQEIFIKHIMPHADKKGDDFFNSISKAISTHILPFFQLLPKDLSNILAMIFASVRDASHFTDSIPPQFSVTTLFINRFLLSPDIRQMIQPPPPFNIEKFVLAANMFKDLFYTIKSQNLNKNFQGMSDSLRMTFEEKTTSYDESRQTDVFSYFVTDPSLRNDYNYLFNYVQMIKFTHSDEKELEVEPFNPKVLEKRKQVDPVQIGEPIKDLKEEKQPVKESLPILEQPEVPKQETPKLETPKEAIKPEIKQQKEADKTIIEKLMGLKEDEDETSQNKLQYEDYNKRQQKQYLDKFVQQVPKSDQTTQTNFALPEPIIQKVEVIKYIEKTQQQNISPPKKELQQVVQPPPIPAPPQRDYVAEERERQQWLQEQILPYKKQIDQLTKRIESMKQQRKTEQELLEKNLTDKSESKDKIIVQQQIQLNLLKNDVDKMKFEMMQITSFLQQSEDKNLTLQQEIEKSCEEKELLYQQVERIQANQNIFNETISSIQQQGKKKGYSKEKRDEEKNEFENTLNQIAKRRNELLAIQNHHEIHSRAIKR